MSEMEEKLTAIYNAFIPDVPAIPDYYKDCREARGGEFLVKEIVRRLQKTKNERLRFLFTGHRGCGKSSELKHLLGIIEKETSILPVYIDFGRYLNFQDVALEDIFLGIVSEVVESVAEKTGTNEEIDFFPKDKNFSVLNKVGSFFAGAEVSLEAGGDIPFLGKVKGNVKKQLEKNPSIRKQIREAIKGNEKRTFLAELNNFLLHIESQLKQKTQFSNLIIIADQLEYINRFKGVEDEIKAPKLLFIDNQDELNISSHILYTVPLALYRSKYGKVLTEIYGNEVFVLPMVKIHHRDNFEQKFELGWTALKQVIKKRLSPNGISLDETFDDDALEHLIRFSGGNIRSLVRFVQDASISVDELPINMSAARNSVKKAVRGFAASIQEDYWKKLAELEMSPNQQIENGDVGYADLLNATAVLEYMNGDETDRDDNVWYAVNPAVRRTIRFEEELKTLKAIK